MTMLDVSWQVLVSLSSFALVLIIHRLAKSLIRSYGRRKHLGSERQKSMTRFVTFVAATAAAFCMLFVWGINLMNIWLLTTSVLGFIGIALFATWSLLSNIVSAFILFFTIPFKVRDVITFKDWDKDMTGKITDMTLFYVYIEDDKGDVICIPNNQLLQKVVVRHSKEQP